MNSRKMMSNCKRRGEWAELQFMAKAAKLGLGVSKPWGEFSRYDMVIESGRRFVSVQIKSTLNLSPEGSYICKVTPNAACKPYQPGEFDFLAVYIIMEDVWYIIPARQVINGKMRAIRLHTSDPNGKYSRYKEAWHLLRPVHAKTTRFLLSGASLESPWIFVFREFVEAIKLPPKRSLDGHPWK